MDVHDRRISRADDTLVLQDRAHQSRRDRRAQSVQCQFLLPPRLTHLLTDAVNANTKSAECYLGLLYAMEDVAVYGYVTPLKVKIVLALALSDFVVRDADIISVSLKVAVLQTVH